MSDVNSATEHPLIRKARESTPVAELIGMRIEDIRDGRAVGWLHAGPQHANPMGTLHGGILVDLADAAMGMAFVSTLTHDESFTTIDLHVHYFRPVWQGLLRADARVVHRGKSFGYIECDVSDDRGRLIARTGSTCTVLRGEASRGR